MYTLPCVKQIAGGKLLYDTSSSAQCFCDDLEGWSGVGGGREAKDAGGMATFIADSCCCTTEINATL